MIEPYATVADLQARFPRTLTPEELAAAPVMLEDATFLLSTKIEGLQAAVDSAIESGTEAEDPIVHAAMLTTVTMVRRALLAQAAQQTVNPAVESLAETWGSYSQSIRYRSPGGNLYLYESELDYLEGLLRGDMASAVSVPSKGL